MFRTNSDTSDVPYSQNQFLGWDFLVPCYSKTALDTILYSRVSKVVADHGSEFSGE